MYSVYEDADRFSFISYKIVLLIVVECFSYILRLGYLDGLVRRRLELTAQYDLRCSLLDDKITRTTIQVTADSHSADLIHIICNQGLIQTNCYLSNLLTIKDHCCCLILKNGVKTIGTLNHSNQIPIYRCCQTRPNKS